MMDDLQARLGRSGRRSKTLHQCHCIASNLTEVVAVWPASNVAQSSLGAPLKRAVEFANNVPSIEDGNAEVLKELCCVLGCRDGFVDAGVRPRIRAKDEGIPIHPRRAGLDPVLFAIGVKTVVEQIVDGLGRTPAIGWKAEADQIVGKPVEIAGLLCGGKGHL